MVAPELPVRRLDPGLPLPAYAHPGDAGADLCAATDVVLPPGGSIWGVWGSGLPPHESRIAGCRGG